MVGGYHRDKLRGRDVVQVAGSCGYFAWWDDGDGLVRDCQGLNPAV